MVGQLSDETSKYLNFQNNIMSLTILFIKINHLFKVSALIDSKKVIIIESKAGSLA